MKPPNVKRPDSAAAQPGRESDSPGGRITGKRTDNPREVQGIAPARHPDQHAPIWRDPPQIAAMRMLERLWGRR